MRRMLFPFRVSLMLLFIFGGAGAITACNTIEGAGKDVDAAGKGITRGAKEVKKDM